MEKYSQYDEQEYILKAVAHISSGRFLDVGAWDPYDKSNTRALYELGWSGIMVEPSPGPLARQLAVYGNDQRVEIIAAAMGLENGLVNLHITDDATSTSDPANYEKWKDASKFLGQMWVPKLTWRNILDQFGAFDVINLDAEGISVELFRELMTIPMRAKCIIVEHDGRYVEVSEPATAAGYAITYQNGTNMVLVHQR